MSSARYEYSYAMNSWLSSFSTDAGKKPPPIGSIKNASDKILAVEEEGISLGDGRFLPTLFNDDGSSANTSGDLLTGRHDKPPREADPVSGPYSTLPNPDLRGNAAFLDGHAEYVTRKIAHNIKSIRWDK